MQKWEINDRFFIPCGHDATEQVNVFKVFASPIFIGLPTICIHVKAIQMTLSVKIRSSLQTINRLRP